MSDLVKRLWANTVIRKDGKAYKRLRNPDGPEAADIIEAQAREIEALRADLLEWAIARWRYEVRYRPLENVHRRSLDDVWRQVVRHFGGDDEALLGPCHDDLLSQRGKVEG